MVLQDEHSEDSCRKSDLLFELEEYGRLNYELLIDINSGGGYVFEAIEIITYIDMYFKGKVTSRCLGEASSSASLLFLVGDNKLHSSFSFINIHKPHVELDGNYAYIASIMGANNKQFIDIYNRFYKPYLNKIEMKKVMDGGELIFNGDELSRFGSKLIT